MYGKFILTSVDDFIRNFVAEPSNAIPRPDPALWLAAFTGMPRNNTKENAFYAPLANCVNGRNLCPGYTLKLVYDRPDLDDPSKQKVDAALFSDSDVLDDGRPQWPVQEMWFEVKKDCNLDDPFVDPDFDNLPLRQAVEGASGRRPANRGQITSYAAMLFSRQQRCTAFTVIILGDHARIVRWDRAGAIVTRKFCYTETTHLGEFLWRFSHMSSEQRGHDPTAHRVAHNSADYELMKRVAFRDVPPSREYIREAFRASFEQSEWPLWKLRIVPEPHQASCDTRTKTKGGHEASARYFLVGKPHFNAEGVVGRSTRGYIAVDCQDESFVFLKDVWRVDHPDMPKEGYILEDLNLHGVEHIPEVVCHEDVESQQTLTQLCWLRTIDEETNPFKTHTHYRLVFDQVYLPLSQFGDGQDLVKVIADCIEAHRQAMGLAGLIHRDVSIGNMLMLPKLVKDMDDKGGVCYDGVSSDWELCKPICDETSKDGEKARQPDRTGTWQFVSAMLLDNPYKPIEIPDELEAFFNVFLYVAVRYTPTNWLSVASFMAEYFDGIDTLSETQEYKCGYPKRAAMVNGCIQHSGKFLLFVNPESSGDHPFNVIMEQILLWLKARYTVASFSLRQRGSDTLPPNAGNRNSGDQSISAAILGDDAGHGDMSEVVNLDCRDGGVDVVAQVKAATAAGVAAQIQQTIPIAQNLETHHAMHELLMKLYNAKGLKWPKRVADRVPTDYNYESRRRGDVHAGKVIPTSQLKRRAPPDQQDSMSSKRPRTETFPHPRHRPCAGSQKAAHPCQ